MATINELEIQVREAGNKLLSSPPASEDELLQLLDQVETCLLKVEQSPSEATQAALSPLLKALISHQLLRHSNSDVRVAVSACLSEITRITAPEEPYGDDQMREVFKLIVSSFENLADNKSRSYPKRMSILDTVAKVRSCVVMLDLECDALILGMFQHFLKAIRDYHPENVFQSMKRIMILVLEESDDNLPLLLSPLLDTVKRNNKEVLPIAQELADKVLKSCAAKIKTSLVQAVRSLGISLDDYSEVVTSICQGSPDASDLNDTHNASGQLEKKAANEVNSDKAGYKEDLNEPNSDKNVEKEVPSEPDGDTTLFENVPRKFDSHKNLDKEVRTEIDGDKNLDEEVPSEIDGDKTLDKEVRTEIDGDKTLDEEAPTEIDTDKTLDGEVPTEIDCDKTLDKEVAISPEDVQEKDDPSSLGNQDAEEDVPNLTIKKVEKEVHNSPDNEQDEEKDVLSSSDSERTLDGNLAAETVVPTENESENTAQSSSPKELEDQNADDVMLSPNESLSEKKSRKAVRSNKKQSLISNELGENISQATGDLGRRPRRHTSKKAPVGAPGVSKSPTSADVSKERRKSDAELKEKQLGKEDKAKSSAKEDGKKRGRKEVVDDEKKTVSQDERSSSEKDDHKDVVSPSKSFKKSSKNYRQLKNTLTSNSKGKKKASDVRKYDEYLVGAKIKVFWPEDVEYYPGKIECFDASEKKHKVLYDDGEVEVLELSKEIWEFLTDSESVEEKGAGLESPDASSERPQKKKAKSSHVANQVKEGASSGKTGTAPSKSKGTIAKSATNSRDLGDGSGKMNGKAVDKSDDHNGGGSKDRKSGSKALNVSSKTNDNFKDDFTNTPKTRESKNADPDTPYTSKPKQDSPKKGPPSKSKGKRSRSSGKSDANDDNNLKTGASKTKENKGISGPAEGPDKVKGKSLQSSKAQPSWLKFGRKRRKVTKS